MLETYVLQQKSKNWKIFTTTKNKGSYLYLVNFGMYINRISYCRLISFFLLCFI